MDVEVQHLPDQHRFDALVDGKPAGYLSYVVRPGDTAQTAVWVLDGTEVDPAYRGRGVAGNLVRGVLEEIRQQWVQVVPECPYVVGWFSGHPDCWDLLDPEWKRPWDS